MSNRGQNWCCQWRRPMECFQQANMEHIVEPCTCWKIKSIGDITHLLAYFIKPKISGSKLTSPFNIQRKQAAYADAEPIPIGLLQKKLLCDDDHAGVWHIVGPAPICP
uniref:Uncharacterized protein n=1 Tax=Arundo donax TaxID=35708 RepID=A0A0A9D1Q5_ARUDO